MKRHFRIANMKLQVRLLVIVAGSSLIVASLAIVDLLSPPELVLEARPSAQRLLIRANYSQSEPQSSSIREESVGRDSADRPPLRPTPEVSTRPVVIDGVEAYLRTLKEVPPRPRKLNKHYRTTLGQRLKWNRA